MVWYCFVFQCTLPTLTIHLGYCWKCALKCKPIYSKVMFFKCSNTKNNCSDVVWTAHSCVFFTRLISVGQLILCLGPWKIITLLTCQISNLFTSVQKFLYDIKTCDIALFSNVHFLLCFSCKCALKCKPIYSKVMFFKCSNTKNNCSDVVWTAHSCVFFTRLISVGQLILCLGPWKIITLLTCQISN